MDPTFWGLLLLGALPAAVIQFICCLFKPVIVKFTPFALLAILWVAAMQTTGFNSLRFAMVLFNIPFLVGIAIGWLLYALFLAARDFIKENKK